MTYGKYIHTVQIKIVKSKLLPVKKAFSRFEVEKMIDNNHSDFRSETFENWAETPKKALPLAVSAMYQSYSPNLYKDMMLSVWGDYYNFEGGSGVFLKEILGSWDGRIEEKPTGVKHFICFNTDKVKIINVEKV